MVLDGRPYGYRPPPTPVHFPNLVFSLRPVVPSPSSTTTREGPPSDRVSRTSPYSVRVLFFFSFPDPRNSCRQTTSPVVHT